MSKRSLGSAAEEHVAGLLTAGGWSVLRRNLRTPYAEVDLVARDPAGVLVLVEVKARHPLDFCDGEDHLGLRQRRRLEAALTWLAERQAAPRGLRLDLVVVHQAGGQVLGVERFEGLAGIEPA